MFLIHAISPRLKLFGRIETGLAACTPTQKEARSRTTWTIPAERLPERFELATYGASRCGSESAIRRGPRPELRARESLRLFASNNPKRNERKANASMRSNRVCAIGDSNTPRKPHVAVISAISNAIRARLNML